MTWDKGKEPHIFVFAQTPPAVGRLSTDRLLVSKIDPETMELRTDHETHAALKRHKEALKEGKVRQ